VPAKSVATFMWNDEGADFDNGSFDDGGFHVGGGSLDAWTTFGDTTGNVSAQGQAVLSGDKSLKLFGQFSGSQNTSGVFQGISVEAGNEIVASLSAFVQSADSIANTSNIAEMRIEFYDQFGAAFGSANFLGDERVLVADGTSLNDQWLGRQLTGVAPNGAVEARLVLQFIQPNNQIGAVHVDNVSFGVMNTTILVGDYDASGVVDGQDYVVWKNNFGSTTQLDADGNGDRVVNAADYVIWRDNLGSALDAKAERAVNVPEPIGLPLTVSGLVSLMRWSLRQRAEFSQVQYVHRQNVDQQNISSTTAE
jgi:hypothetical protein